MTRERWHISPMSSISENYIPEVKSAGGLCHSQALWKTWLIHWFELNSQSNAMYSLCLCWSLFWRSAGKLVSGTEISKATVFSAAFGRQDWNARTADPSVTNHEARQDSWKPALGIALAAACVNWNICQGLDGNMNTMGSSLHSTGKNNCYQNSSRFPSLH